MVETVPVLLKECHMHGRDVLADHVLAIELDRGIFQEQRKISTMTHPTDSGVEMDRKVVALGIYKIEDLGEMAKFVGAGGH